MENINPSYRYDSRDNIPAYVTPTILPPTYESQNMSHTTQSMSKNTHYPQTIVIYQQKNDCTACNAASNVPNVIYLCAGSNTDNSTNRPCYTNYYRNNTYDDDEPITCCAIL